MNDSDVRKSTVLPEDIYKSITRARRERYWVGLDDADPSKDNSIVDLGKKLASSFSCSEVSPCRSVANERGISFLTETIEKYPGLACWEALEAVSLLPDSIAKGIIKKVLPRLHPYYARQIDKRLLS